MKELSIKQKAQRYDEALERAKEKYAMFEGTKQGDVLEDVFPELKESEDEMIRNQIIEHIKWSYDEQECAEEEMHRWISWLEKQGEQKSIDDLTPQEAMDIAVAKCFEQGEQKPTIKVEPFDKYEGLTDFEGTLADICIGWIGEEYGWKQYIKDNADVLLGIAIKKFNSVQDAPFEQNPVWSEEDEVKINRIVACLKNLNVADNDILLKDVAWLKSLRPQNRWKPSDEQMQHLSEVVHEAKYKNDISVGGYSAYMPLANLYLDLKKLKGE